jgi:photosystem II stability/assembly factor-like uncharacterized protein
MHVDHHAAAYEPGSTNTLWVGTDGGFWRSTDDGATWVGKNDALITYQFYDICVNNNPDTPYYVMGGTQDNGTDKWSGTTTWSDGLFADGMVCNINPANGTRVYAEIQNGQHYRHNNSGDGNPWTAINAGLTGSGLWVTPVDLGSSGRPLYTSTSDGIFSSNSGGTSWTNVAAHQAWWISISPSDSSVVWTLEPWSGNVRLTTDDGVTWGLVAPFGFPTGVATKVLAHPVDTNAALVVFSGYAAGIAHVALTTDSGATWADVTGDFPTQPVNTIVVDPDQTDDWYIGTDVGVWSSTDGGTTWLPLDALGLPNAVVSDLEISRPERKLVAGTYGRGLWELDIPLAGSDVAITPARRPTNLMLDAPHPNPAVDRTLLRFAARSQSPVTLSVYDVRGRLVSRLAEIPAGDAIVRTTPWMTADVPNGVYFAVLRAGEESLSRKIVVAK